jgi:hypothetical protein
MHNGTIKYSSKKPTINYLMQRFLLIILSLLFVSACSESAREVSLNSDESLIRILSRDDGQYGDWTQMTHNDIFETKTITTSFVEDKLSPTTKGLAVSSSNGEYYIVLMDSRRTGDYGNYGYSVTTKFLPENKIESNYFNFTDSPNDEKQLKLASTPKGLLAFIEKLSTQKTLIMQYENDYDTYNYKFDIDGSPHIVIKSSE